MVARRVRGGATPPPTARGFEPLLAEPNGFRVHLLGRSGTLSMMRAKTGHAALGCAVGATPDSCATGKLRRRHGVADAARHPMEFHARLLPSGRVRGCPGGAARLEPTWGACPADSEPLSPTARGFEPLRAEPNGFLAHHLSHSVRLSMVVPKHVIPSSGTHIHAERTLPRW